MIVFGQAVAVKKKVILAFVLGLLIGNLTGVMLCLM